MSKKYAIIALIVVSIIISGCTYSPYSDPKTVQNTNFHTGTQGIYMRFLPQTPPLRIYSNTPMNIMVEYSNKGAYKITNGRLYISGFDKQYIRPSTDIYPITAEEKSVFNPQGLITQTADFSVPQVILPMGVDKVTQTIKATACYEYMTEASVEVCIDPMTTTTNRERTCIPQPSYAAGGSQGAPVAVTRVEQEVYKNKVQFRIYFQNVGGGTVFKNTAINDCHISLNRQDANKIELVSVEYSGRPMRCQPLNPINLDESGIGFVYCEDTLYEQSDAYKTVLQIKLRYGYRTSIQTDVNILKEP